MFIDVDIVVISSLEYYVLTYLYINYKLYQIVLMNNKEIF